MCSPCGVKQRVGDSISTTMAKVLLYYCRCLFGLLLSMLVRAYFYYVLNEPQFLVFQESREAAFCGTTMKVWTSVSRGAADEEAYAERTRLAPRLKK